MAKTEEMQFGHINTYARAPKSGKNGKARSVKDILNEVARTPENCPHVENPQPPIHIAGMTPSELANSIDRLLDERKIEGKRKPRGDVHVLAAAVYSWPEHVAYYDKGRLELWMTEQIEWHKKNVGLVDCVMLHLDESFPHIHVYSADPDARRLVPGATEKRKAEAEAKAQGESTKAICKIGNQAFKSAMSEWQDDLYNEVSKYHGLERLGPRRQRLPRSEWRAAKTARLTAGDRLREIRDETANGEQTLKILEASIDGVEILIKDHEKLKEDAKNALFEVEFLKKKLAEKESELKLATQLITVDDLNQSMTKSRVDGFFNTSAAKKNDI